MEFNFRISGEDFAFTLVKDVNGNLTSFTATNDATIYNCEIQVTSSTNPQEVKCCTPSGCVEGPC